MKCRLLLFLLSLTTSLSSSAFISVEDYEKIRTKFYLNFKDEVFSKRQKELFFDLWDYDGKASVQCHDQICQVIIAKGFFDHEENTPEHLEAILCHEMGHLLGEKYKNDSKYTQVHMSNYSAEGEADYFSTKICLPKIMDNSSIKFPIDMPKIMEKCLEVYKSEVAINLCYKSVAMSKAPLGQIDYSTGDNPYQHDIRQGTLYSYPSNECRFATLVAGALNRDRPDCWYVPNNKIPSKFRIQ